MLLLRLTIGSTTFVSGVIYLFERKNLAAGAWFFGLAAVVLGGSLLIGFFTPISGSLVSLGGILFVLLRFSINNFDSSAAIYTIAVSAAVVMLGPGAFSIDARMFGRREIIIPGKSDSPQK